jgi:hypothetical protein
VVEVFAKITTHMHLKDFSNGKEMAGYCPLGIRVVDIESILKRVTVPTSFTSLIAEMLR